MKSIKYLACLTILAITAVSCGEDFLKEQPKTLFVPSYFNTEAGVEGGLHFMYYHLRNVYGGGNMINQMGPGTDEFTTGGSARIEHQVADMGEGTTQWSASQNPASSTWTECFGNINTANGVIENGEANGVSPALLAEARFFRAFDYFLLVQTFGGVPMDLGSGELKFNATPSRTSIRNTVDEVYDKCIIPDFQYAVDNLPDLPRTKGAVTKTVARLYLAKAYLTYAWWNENPKNIPTYPEVTVNAEGVEHKVVRSASNAGEMFKKAYKIAIEGIQKSPDIYGLEATSYDLWKGSNKYSKEFLLYADYTIDNVQYGGTNLTSSGGGAPDNCEFWYHNPNYTYIRAGVTPERTISSSGVEEWAKSEAITRSAEQGYGRPWTRMAPIHEVFYNTFYNDHDSRLDITFNLAYRQNFSRFNKKDKSHVVYGANNLPVEYDGVILRFLSKNQEPGKVVYPMDRPGVKDMKGPSAYAGGEMEGESAFVIEPSHIGRNNYPGPWKTSVYRTDKADDAPGAPDSGNFRPLVIARFAELYFVAAEAYVKGATGDLSASDLMKVIRARAGKWNFSVADQKEVSYDYSDELVAETPDVVTLDWLLDEYSREFFGESRRWFDLVRTQTWTDRATTYRMTEAFTKNDPEEHTYKRVIEPYHYIRPIPIDHLNGLEMTEEDKAVYQNPGYLN